MHSSVIDRHLQSFVESCRRHGLKITPQRVAVYRALLESDQHPTADAMFQTVKLTYPHISFDTVNRTLLTFAEIGLVDVVEVFGGPKRFDPDTGDHHHLHCVACGRIIDFIHEGYNGLDVPDAIASKFKVISKRVVLKGLCDKCTGGRP
jgi:Fur family transcriptional regulator, peroxide stress response regulator